MIHFIDHNEVADQLRDANTVSDDRSECSALHEAVAKGKFSSGIFYSFYWAKEKIIEGEHF